MNILAHKDYDAVQEIAKSLLDEGTMYYTPERGMMKSMDMQKALDATTTTSMTDLSQLTGGRAITIENIDTDLKSTVAEQKQLRLWNLFPHSPIYAVLDQYMLLSSQGQLGGHHSYGVFTNESSFPTSKNVTLARKVDTTKFLRDMRDLTHVLDVSKTFADAHTILNKAGAMTVLEASEKASVFGNSDVIPNEFDGLYKKIQTAKAAGYDVVIDCRKTGAASGSEGGQISEGQLDLGANNIMQGLGAATHMLMPNTVKQDLNEILPMSRRVNLGGGQQLDVKQLMGGLPMAGFMSDFAYNGWGDGSVPHFKFVTQIDKYLPSGESASSKAPTVAVGTAPTAPLAAGIVLANVADPATEFSAGDLGDYFYRVSAVNANGESIANAAAAGAITVLAGNKVRLTITGADATITGYRIFRSAMNASDDSDCRWIMDVAATVGVGDTIVYDLNSVLPGTSIAILMTNAPEFGAIDYRQLLPFVRIPLAFGLNSIVGWPYLYMLYHYLRVSKMENEQTGFGYHILFKNIRYSKSTF